MFKTQMLWLKDEQQNQFAPIITGPIALLTIDAHAPLWHILARWWQNWHLAAISGARRQCRCAGGSCGAWGPSRRRQRCGEVTPRTEKGFGGIQAVPRPRGGGGQRSEARPPVLARLRVSIGAAERPLCSVGVSGKHCRDRRKNAAAEQK